MALGRHRLSVASPWERPRDHSAVAETFLVGFCPNLDCRPVEPSPLQVLLEPTLPFQQGSGSPRARLS